MPKAEVWLQHEWHADDAHALTCMQDFMMAAHCFMAVFTDLGWRVMDEAGRTDGPYRPGFVWHTEPGCVLLPGDARICFLRCDNATCMLGEVWGQPRCLCGWLSHSLSCFPYVPYACMRPAPSR